MCPVKYERPVTSKKNLLRQNSRNDVRTVVLDSNEITSPKLKHRFAT